MVRMTTAAQDALLIWLEPRFLDLAGSPLGSARAGNHAFGKTGARLFCNFSIVSLVYCEAYAHHRYLTARQREFGTVQKRNHHLGI